MGLKLITPADQTIISLDEAKAHLRVDFDDDDDLIQAFIDAVVTYVEGPRGYLARALADQTWDYYLDGFPDRCLFHSWHSRIEVPLPPMIELIGVFYRDNSGNEQEFDAGSYIVDLASEPANISLASGKAWPSVCRGLNAVRIRFRAGYLDTSSPPVFALPPAIKVGLLLLISTLYDNRSDTIVGDVGSRMPFAAESLLKPYVAQRGFA